MPKLHPKILLVCVVLLYWSASNRCMAESKVDFATQIKPIFAENCIACHGPDEASREADLRLDQFSDHLVSQSIVVTSDPDQSKLLHRILSADADEVMPPPSHGAKLNDDQIRLIKQWIQEGASFSKHWAFEKPVKSSVEGHANPIDWLVQQRLASEGMSLSPRANAATLCRRIYLDLIGLPPTIEQLNKFVEQAASGENAEQSSRKAVEELVDELLNRHEYGEKWARHWLDVARYSDTNGFEKDLPREQWAWRDWVIDSLNKDQPYKEFLIEQIAGDLLPNATQDQRIATGFLRNGMVNEEGAIVPEQFRIEGNFDRMDCIGRSILGLTFQCAQCHSHKFDPINHDEYYGMFSAVNNTHESQIWVYTKDQQNSIQRIENDIRAIYDSIKAKMPDWNTRMNEWSNLIADEAKRFIPLSFDEPVLEGGLNHPISLEDHSVLTLGHPTTQAVITLLTKPQATTVSELRLEALQHGDLPFGGPGRSYRGTFAISEVILQHRKSGSQDWTSVVFQSARADFEETDHELEEYFFHAGYDKDKRRRVGPASFLFDGDQKTAWRADRGPGRRNSDSVVVLGLQTPLSIAENDELRIQLHMNHGGDGNGRDNLLLGRFRLSVSPQTSSNVPIDHAAALAIQEEESQRTEAEQQRIFRAWCAAQPELADDVKKLNQIEMQYPEATTSVLTLSQPIDSFERKTFVYDRGEWDKPTRVAKPQVPQVLHPIESAQNDRHLDRLQFANWLASKDSPLTARVHVNRVWQAIFGRGLVETSEDFGTRTPTPRYQDVLDTLAVEFMEDKWSQKRLVRVICTSDVYAQDSKVSQESFVVDPYNEKLARGPRFRLEAEVIRDLTLHVSGLLHSKVGGPSFYPPVPQSVLDDNYIKLDYWNESPAPERYRRALYMFRKRAMPDPVMTSFDSPNSDVSCTRRVRSNTPLAALVSLNEPVFVEAARALAMKVLREGGNDDAQRVDYLMMLCTARTAHANEHKLIQQALLKQRERLGDGWLSIREIALGDEGAIPELPAHATPRDLAAWTIISRAVLNMDETLCKN